MAITAIEPRQSALQIATMDFALWIIVSVLMDGMALIAIMK